jgi:hypothetical protein
MLERLVEGLRVLINRAVGGEKAEFGTLPVRTG